MMKNFLMFHHHFIFFDTSKRHLICWCVMGPALLETTLNVSASSALQDKHEVMGVMRRGVRKRQIIFIPDKRPQRAMKTAEQQPLRGLQSLHQTLYSSTSQLQSKAFSLTHFLLNYQNLLQYISHIPNELLIYEVDVVFNWCYSVVPVGAYRVWWAQIMLVWLCGSVWNFYMWEIILGSCFQRPLE